MYSVLLAAMLTTTSATPDWGCHGCCGGAFCQGGYGCSGWNICHGCCGGCYGCHAYNAFSGCCGGCYGCSGCWGCSGCCGGTWTYASCYGCSGCCGGCCGGVVVCSGMPYATDQTASGAREKSLEEKVRRLEDQLQKLQGDKKKSGEVSAPVPAHVVVKLPQDARLFVDETPCPLTSATRAFDTPQLQPGQVYYYTLRAEATRDGQTVKDSKRVSLRAGKETLVEFGDLQSVETARR